MSKLKCQMSNYMAIKTFKFKDLLLILGVGTYYYARNNEAMKQYSSLTV